MNWVVVDEECPECCGVGDIFYRFEDPQNDYDKPCGRCVGRGVVERIAWKAPQTASKAPLGLWHDSRG